MIPIEIPVSELKTALPGLSRLIARRSTLPVLGCVRVCRLGSGQLTLQTTDLDATATFTTTAPVTSNITKAGQTTTAMLVPYEELTQAIKGAGKDDTVQLVPDLKQPKLRHRVAGSWLERPLPVFPDDEWPAMPRIDTEALPLPPEFPAALAAALDCAADASRSGLHGVWLDVSDPKAHYVFASNGRRLFTANSFTFGLKESLFIPHHRFLQWSGFREDGPWQLSLRAPAKGKEGGLLKLAGDRWSLVVRQRPETCPNWRGCVPTEALTRIRFSDTAAATLVALLPKLPSADEPNYGVTFRFGERETTVTGQAKEHHSTVGIEGVRVEGPAQVIGVNRNYVLQALQFGLRQLDLIDELTPYVFHESGRRLVVSPLRLNTAGMGPTPASPADQPTPLSAPAASGSTTEPPTTPTGPEPMKAPSQTITDNPTETPTETLTALKQAIAQVENLKATVKGMLTDLNDVLKTLHVAKKEKRATEKEVEEVRAALESVKRLRL